MTGAVTLVPHDPLWAKNYQSEAARIAAALGDTMVAIHHVGSTSVPGLIAKPVIDILLEVENLDALDGKASAMHALGYTARGENGIAGRRYYVRQLANGSRSHQIHAFAAGKGQVASHLAFRNHLRANPAIAAEYAGIKRISLAQSDSRAAYQAGKDRWVTDMLATLGLVD